MTNAATVPGRWRPWSRPARRGVDLALAIPVVVLGTGWLVLDWMFGLGLAVWAAQGDRRRIDAADLAHIGRVRVLLVAVLASAVLAAAFRARRTVVAQLLVALLAGGVLMASQHEWQEHHTPPGCVRYSANC
ncbi:DUF6234 family protein [Streptomyces sp. NPDC052040]|uniref:DUF6234 family protein n=1 Tax=Streptomyces sp. NPDC052040 TaxID=3365682 RepID=UPI0037D8B1BD